MGNTTSTNGLIILAAGFLASSVSSFLEHFALLGTATEFATGLFDGLSVVAFCVAIFVLVRGARAARP
jgi:hypothetical protein